METRPRNTPPSSLDVARKKLATQLRELKTASADDLFSIGCGLYRAVDEAIKNKSMPDEISRRILFSASIILGGNVAAGGKVEYDKELDFFDSLSYDIRQFPLGTVIAGMMLALIGTVIVAASGIIAAASFGLLVPFSVFGFVFGASVLIGGVAMGLNMFGMFSAMAGGKVLSDAAQENPVRQKMAQLTMAMR